MVVLISHSLLYVIHCYLDTVEEAAPISKPKMTADPGEKLLNTAASFTSAPAVSKKYAHIHDQAKAADAITDFCGNIDVSDIEHRNYRQKLIATPECH